VGSVRLLGLAAVLLATAATASVPTGAQAGAAESKQLAEGSANDFRAVVTAQRGSAAAGGEPPTASATMEGFQRTGDTWTSVGKLPIGDQTWAWFVLTDLGAVCDFAVSDTPRPSVTVKLLYSQSIGCADAASFHVENGKLVEG
jgi:hypothetical protein